MCVYYLTIIIFKNNRLNYLNKNSIKFFFIHRIQSYNDPKMLANGTKISNRNTNGVQLSTALREVLPYNIKLIRLKILLYYIITLTQSKWSGRPYELSIFALIMNISCANSNGSVKNYCYII